MLNLLQLHSLTKNDLDEIGIPAEDHEKILLEFASYDRILFLLYFAVLGAL